MKNLILAAMIALGSIAPLAAAHAGEGNGPSFPGLQVPNIGIATGPYGQHRVVAVEEHSADVYASQVLAEPVSAIRHAGTEPAHAGDDPGGDAERLNQRRPSRCRTGADATLRGRH